MGVSDDLQVVLPDLLIQLITELCPQVTGHGLQLDDDHRLDF